MTLPDSETHINIDVRTLQSEGLQGNRAERKLRAFAKQGLSGVMATSADYPTLPQSGREERNGKETYIYTQADTEYMEMSMTGF